MFFIDSSQEQNSDQCANGHSSTNSLHTDQGTTFCFLCFSDLISQPNIPTVHVSYALHQLSLALSEKSHFLQTILSSHVHFLVSPLIHALSSFDDDPIAIQIIDIISLLCSADGSSIGEEFMDRISCQLSAGSLGWSRRQLHMLHCFGLVMNCKNIEINSYIRDKEALVSQLAEGLQLPSEEIRGEILFVLYKFSALQFTEENVDGIEVIAALCPSLLCLSLDILAKTQRDDVRLNCIALLTILAQQGLLASMNLDGDDPMQTADPCLNVLFAEAIKGPLLSIDSEVQIRSLDLIFHYVSQERFPRKQIHVLIEENVADYIFEILRLSECKDEVINSCLRVLDLFSLAGEDSFRKRLVIGFPSVIKVFHYVARVPCHPFQIQTLKIVLSCITYFPGIASTSQVEEILLVLKSMLERYYSQEMGLFPETFAIICSILVSLMKTPSSATTSPDVLIPLQESLRHAIVGSCLSLTRKDSSSQISHAVYLLNEAYVYSINKTSCTELRHYVIDLCASHLLPWFVANVNGINEEATLGIMETFHSVLLHKSELVVTEFAETLISANWFSFSFGCLGNFSTDKMIQRVYLLLSSLVDVVLNKQNSTGSRIRDALPCLPCDPQDLLFLLGQDSSDNHELASCQLAALVIFHTSWIFNDRLADDRLVLASLEKYILLKRTSLICGDDSSAMMHLLNLYSLCRSLENERYQISYNVEAERILFYMLNEYEWDLCSSDIHIQSLKWLFQQENISRGLTRQIQNISRNNFIGNQVHNVYGDDGNQRSLMYWFANLVSQENDCATSLLVSLLTRKEEQENDWVSVLSLMSTVVCISPAASNSLSMNGIGTAINKLIVCGYTNGTSSLLLVLIFNILASVQSRVLKNDDESWNAVFLKLLSYLSLHDTSITTQKHEYMMVISILSLVLYHSKDGVLVEASLSIVLSPYLVSAINTVVDVALTQYQDEALAFILPLYFFSLRSFKINLSGAVDWQTFFGLPSVNLKTLPVVCIDCHHLCRLMHFGTPQVKLLASYCLLELFTRLSEQIDIKKEQLGCSSSYLKSIKSVLGGLVFYDDIRVATNSALCLSLVLGWEGRRETLQPCPSSWYRFVAEEMSVSLAAMPFSNHNKPALYLTVSVLRLEKKPTWLKTVFHESCISSLIQNLNVMNINGEIVILFQELLKAQLLNSDHVAKLFSLFQARRKPMHRDGTLDEENVEGVQQSVSSIHDSGHVCNYLVYLMVSSNSFGRETKGIFNEIEQFSKLSSKRVNGVTDTTPCKVYTRKRTKKIANRVS